MMVRVLFAHERPSVRRIVSRVLELEGFHVRSVADGIAAKQMLERERWDALVVDVGLPGVPGYELCDFAKSSANRGAKVVVLVSSVYRRTSYKRRPSRLYGADDYVEIHHLGDQLPTKLRQHLGMTSESEATEFASRAAAAELRAEGDTRFGTPDIPRLAQLIVADMVLYNGDRILGAGTLTEAATAVAEDLEVARDLFAQVCRGEGNEGVADESIAAAFRDLMQALGRGEDVAP